MMGVFVMLMVVMILHVYTGTKTHPTVHFKCVKLRIHSYLNKTIKELMKYAPSPKNKTSDISVGSNLLPCFLAVRTVSKLLKTAVPRFLHL